MGAIAVGLASIFANGDLFRYQLWSDRALFRSIDLFQDFHFGAAELTTGGQTPGSFFYLLLRAIQILTVDPLTIHRLMLIAFVASVIAAYALACRVADPLSSLMGVALMVASRPLFSNLFELTNPAFTPLLSVGIWWIGISIVRDRRVTLLPLFILLVVLAGQIHMSFYLLLPPLALVMAVNRIRPNIKTIHE